MTTLLLSEWKLGLWRQPIEHDTYVLSEVLAEDEEETKSSVEKDEEQIKARLKALGYID